MNLLIVKDSVGLTVLFIQNTARGVCRSKTMCTCNLYPCKFQVCLQVDINPFRNKPWFLRVSSTSLLKTLWEKGEIARNEQLLLYPVFSTHLETLLPFSSNLKFMSANYLSLEESKDLLFGKGLTHYQTTNFRLFQTERACRQQFQI